MRMDSCLILLCLFVFVKGNKEDVSQRCNKTADDIQSGQNLTIHCEINSSDHRSKEPCEAKDIRCEYNSKWFKSCMLKVNPTDESRIRHYSVEFSNVTIKGIYTMSLENTCGFDLNYSFKINVTNAAPTISPQTRMADETKPYIAMAVVCVALALVAIIAVVILRIRKRRRSTTAERIPAYGTKLLTTL